jgi:preprotein translocase subunit SecG
VTGRSWLSLFTVHFSLFTDTMVYFLYGLFFVSCLVLVGAVLLQPGKTDAGALFTSNIASSALSPRGTTTVLSKITIAAAALFMISAMFLGMPAVTGDVSVLNSNPESQSEAPVDANTNTVPDANANTTAPGDANANTASSNANTGSLIETPATDEVKKEAANARSANSVPANAAVTGTSNKAPAKKK